MDVKSCVFTLVLGFIHICTVAANLRCIECTHINWNYTYHFDGAQSIYNILRSKYNPACAQYNPLDRALFDRNYQNYVQNAQLQQAGQIMPMNYDIGETICQSFNTANRCSYYIGDVIIRLQNYKDSATNNDARMTLNMHVRNCQTTTTDYENRCYDRNTDRGYYDVRQFFQDRLSFISRDLEVEKFLGQQCFCSTDMCKSVVSGAQRFATSVSAFIFSLVITLAGTILLT